MQRRRKICQHSRFVLRLQVYSNTGKSTQIPRVSFCILNATQGLHCRICVVNVEVISKKDEVI